MYKKTNVLIGLILVAFGGLFLLNNMNILNVDFSFGHLIQYFWPAMFLILPGLIFHYSFFMGGARNPGLLVPGGLFLVSGISSEIAMLFGAWDVMWTGFIFAIAVGLFELYLFGNGDAGVLVPVGILGTVGLTCLISTMFNAWGFMWPGFILSVPVGLFLLYVFGNRDKGLLIPVFILGGLSVIFFATFSLSWIFTSHIRQFFISITLILVGVAIIFRNSRMGYK